MNDLTPCPFCGGTNLFKSRRYDGSKLELFRVGCNACSSMVEHPVKAVAIASWNKRAATPETDAVVRERARLAVQDGHSWRGHWNSGVEMCSQIMEIGFQRGYRSAEYVHGIK